MESSFGEKWKFLHCLALLRVKAFNRLFLKKKCQLSFKNWGGGNLSINSLSTSCTFRGEPLSVKDHNILSTLWNVVQFFGYNSEHLLEHQPMLFKKLEAQNPPLAKERKLFLGNLLVRRGKCSFDFLNSSVLSHNQLPDSVFSIGLLLPWKNWTAPCKENKTIVFQ